MNIKINSKAFLNALSLAYKAIPSKAAIPILENFRIEGSAAGVVITATNSNLSIICAVDAVSDDGAIVVPAKILLDVMRNLPNIDVTLRTENNSTCVVDWGNGNSALPSFPPQDYPFIAVPQNQEPHITIKGKDLKAALAHTLPCTGKDEIRPVLSGVFCNVKPDKIDFVGTDSHILAIYPIASENQQQMSFCIPGAAAALVKDAAADDDEVNIFSNNNGVHFGVDGIVISARKIEGNFPRYESIIPTHNNNQAIADKLLFASSIKRVSVCSSKASGTIKLTLNSDTQIKAEAQDLGFSIAATEFVPGTVYQGDSMIVGFKSDYLIKGLNIVGSDKLILKLLDSRHAALIVPQEPEVDPCTILIMPVLVQ